MPVSRVACGSLCGWEVAFHQGYGVGKAIALAGGLRLAPAFAPFVATSVFCSDDQVVRCDVAVSSNQAAVATALARPKFAKCRHAGRAIDSRTALYSEWLKGSDDAWGFGSKEADVQILDLYQR